jgi:hypothetical protein
MTIPIEHRSAVLSAVPRLCRGRGEVALTEIAAHLRWPVADVEQVVNRPGVSGGSDVPRVFRSRVAG